MIATTTPSVININVRHRRADLAAIGVAIVYGALVMWGLR